MYQYCITVSHNGYFLFRTDWENSEQQARLTYSLLIRTLPVGYSVTLSKWTVPTGQDIESFTKDNSTQEN